MLLGYSEQDKVLFSSSDFVILPDMKWDLRTILSLYLVALVQDRETWSLRDFRKQHIPLLKAIENKGERVVEEKWALGKGVVRMYIHPLAVSTLWDGRCKSPEEEEVGGEWTHTPDTESLDENIEVGDQIYATTLCLPLAVAKIQASQTTSQHLAEAFAANSQPKPFHSTVPNHLHDFEDVFSKASFDSLPEHKQWDHAIELIPDAEPSSCKVYPLAPCEQDKLDVFLQENLSSGRIQPSKSPMASPVFFIKKKDGSLCLVQDYHVLNEMTVKKRYPLPLISELVNNL
ncbi:hypothetical protein E4T56_gene14126 [Termitomyces sp. T112]|nr:hypothetical protein E4T56_gene14126 [Termitomyces sp. T112]